MPKFSVFLVHPDPLVEPLKVLWCNVCVMFSVQLNLIIYMCFQINALFEYLLLALNQICTLYSVKVVLVQNV